MKNKIYSTLSVINVNDKTEKKGNQTYLSWAYAWGEAKKHFPDIQRKVYEDPNGHNYFTDGKTCWVKVGIEIEGLEHIDYLPIMDMRNNPIPYERVNSFDVNKAIQRSATKAIAMHGLGLYIYSGEDMPDAGNIIDAAVATAKADGFKVVTQKQIDEAGVIDRTKLTQFMVKAKQRGDSWETVKQSIVSKKGEIDIKTMADIHNEYVAIA